MIRLSISFLPTPPLSSLLTFINCPWLPIAQLRWGRWGAHLPPAFHTLAKDMSLDRGAIYILHLGKAMYYLILLILNIPAPPSQNYPVAPLLATAF